MAMPNAPQRSRPDPQKDLVGFVVGEVEYAVDIAHVREIVNPLAITSLPHTPPEVSGVADHRGEVVPVIDLRVRFGLPPASTSRGTKWLLLNAGEHAVGLVVDRVTDVFGTGGLDLAPTPEVGGRKDVRGILGVARHGDGLTFVLDTARFVALADDLAAQGAI